MEALRRQKRALHGLERRASLRLHKLLKEAATSLAAAAGQYVQAAGAGAPGPCFAQAVLACLQQRGRLQGSGSASGGSGDGQAAAWGALPQVVRFGLSADGQALAEQVHRLKLELNQVGGWACVTDRMQAW
jgi:hypothetical protein